MKRFAPYLLIVAALAIILFLLRLPWSAYYVSGDFFSFIEPWIIHIRNAGGWCVFSEPFSDYMPLYLYMLVPLAFTPRYLVLTKVLSVALTFFAAVVSGYIAEGVCQKPIRNRWLFSGVVAAVLLTPQMLGNAVLWAQCDALWTGLALLTLLLLMRHYEMLAMLVMGFALGAKLQAVFMLPVVYYVFLRRRLPWWYLLFIPLGIFLTILPAWLEGWPMGSLLTIYFNQGSEPDFSANFPNFYFFLDGIWGWELFGAYRNAVKFGITAFLAVVTLVIFPIIARRDYLAYRNITHTHLLDLALLCALIYPYLLPGMHDRYLYLAEVLAVIRIFRFPKLWWQSVMVLLISVPSYINFLFLDYTIPGWIFVITTALYVATILILLRSYRLRYRLL